MKPAMRRFSEQLATIPPQHLGGAYVATITLTALLHYFVPALWLPLAAIDILAFIVLFVAAALLRPDEDVLLSGFLVTFAVGIAILVSKAIVGVIEHRSIGAVALSAPVLAVALLLRGLIFVPLMALLIWIARRVQRAIRPQPPARARASTHRRTGTRDR